MAMPTVNTYERLLRICGQSCVLLVAISACFCFHPRLVRRHLIHEQRDSEARQNLPARVRRADWELVAGSAGREGSVGYLLDPSKARCQAKMKAEIY